MAKLKSVFKVGDVEYAARVPSPKDSKEANKVYNKAFKEALEDGAFLRVELDGICRKKNLWDDAKQVELEAIQKTINDGERKLKAGGIKKGEARKMALEMRQARAKRRLLVAERDSLDQHTAEAQAEQQKFNYLASVCIVKNDDGKPVYKDADEYLAKDDEIAMNGAKALSELLYGLDAGWEMKLPENQFLLKYKFCDEDGRLVRGDGKFVSADGKLIDKDGYYVNEDGKRINLSGELVGEDGEVVVEFKEFLDDEAETVSQTEEKVVI